MRWFEEVRRGFALLTEVSRVPRVSINLKYSRTTGNDPFYGRITRDYYRQAVSRHRRFPLIRQFEYGCAIALLPTAGGSAYRTSIEASARRNINKAMRLGYCFRRIDYNAHLDDVTGILRSVKVRQGRPMPEALLREAAKPHSNPPSSHPSHDYPYFGVFRDQRLVAFAGCLVAGELCGIQTIYGHANVQPDGVVPLLISSITDRLAEDHQDVKYYSYGSYFGATESMRRFKRKFNFQPHRVTWKLGD